jgi:hypothetical protein
MLFRTVQKKRALTLFFLSINHTTNNTIKLYNVFFKHSIVLYKKQPTYHNIWIAIPPCYYFTTHQCNPRTISTYNKLFLFEKRVHSLFVSMRVATVTPTHSTNKKHAFSYTRQQ